MTTREKQIGRRIERLRKEAGYKSQIDLAKEVKVTRASVSSWEDGKNIPKWAVMARLAEALHTTEVNILFGIDEKKVSTDRRFLAYVSEDEEELLTAYRAAEEVAQTMIKDNAKTLADKYSKKAEVIHIAKRAGVKR